jgi:hypothetical protein
MDTTATLARQRAATPAARSDGYVPLIDHLYNLSVYHEAPERVAKLIVRTAVRLDTAHHLVEELRVEVDRTQAIYQSAFATFGLAEVVVTALYRAFDSAKLVSSKAGVGCSVTLPALVEHDLRHLDPLRNYCEHIEGLRPRGAAAQMTEWADIKAIAIDRELRRGSWRLGIDEPLTKRIQAVRDYLLEVWLTAAP